MVSDDTLKARTAAELYRRGAYQPDWEPTEEIAQSIAPASEQGSAQSAIERTALADLAPITYMDGTGQSAIQIERGPRGQINARLTDWIERHDPDELPFGLK